MLKSITQLIPEFKALFRFGDLASNGKNTARMIELFTPLHMIKQRQLKRASEASDAAISAEISKLRSFIVTNRTAD